MLYDTPNATTGKTHFGGPQYALSHFGSDTKTTVYTGLIALVLNIAVAVVTTLVLRALKRPDGANETVAADYVADFDDPRVSALPATPAEEVPVSTR